MDEIVPEAVVGIAHFWRGQPGLAEKNLLLKLSARTEICHLDPVQVVDEAVVGLKVAVPEDVNRAYHKIASANQHPMIMCTAGKKRKDYTACGGWYGAKGQKKLKNMQDVAKIKK